MTQIHRRFQIKFKTIPLSILFCATLAAAQGGLQSINPPQGGKIVYGQVQGQTTEAGAMGQVLRSLHTSLGDRPQVGKLFHVHGTESVATFFTVNRKDQGAAKPIAGLLIATKVANGHVEAALISDDAARFPTSMGPLTKTLFAAWHPFKSADYAGPGDGPVASAAPAQLHEIVLQDQSATVGLPDGWKLVPRMSQMGSVAANGPNGESTELGLMFLAWDTNNANVQRTMQTIRNGGLRGTSYASAAYLPFGGDAAKTFVYLMQDARQKAHLSQANYSFKNVTPSGGSNESRCYHMEGTVDFNGGQGPQEQNLLFCTYPPNRFGSWSSLAYLTTVPVQLAPRERATMGAILQSFNVNESVVARQAGQIAKPQIDLIHAIGKAAAEQARVAHAQEDAQHNSVYKHWDDMDKRSQEFSNYQLDNAVISTADHQYHGTFTQAEAAQLVQDNPDKFEFVAAPDYWKGIDY